MAEGAEVAPAAPPAAGANGEGQQQQQGSGIFWQVARMVLFYVVLSYVRGSGQKSQGDRPGPNTISPKFQKNEVIDIHAFISESPNFQPLDLDKPIWVATEVNLPPTEAFTMSSTYLPSEAAKNNGTVYMHMALARAGYPIDPTDEIFDRHSVWFKTYPLVHYMKPPKKKEGVSLLSNDTAPAQAAEPVEPRDEPVAKQAVIDEDTLVDDEADVGGIIGSDGSFNMAALKPKDDRPLLSYWRTNITLALIDDFTHYPRNGIPAHMNHVMHIDHSTMSYYPMTYVHDFWLMREKMIRLNDTVTELPIHVHIDMHSGWFWPMLMSVEQNFQTQMDSGLMQEGESDEFKRVLLEGNPYFLGLTMFVSLLHSVFDILAFKNDIGFWKQNKSMEGLSARTVCINAFCQLVIFLYLLDNETSYMILISSFVGMLIEFWKITKAMDVSINRSRGFPIPVFKDRGSYVHSKTKQYDQEATKYLSWVLIPLVFCYCGYSLVYDTHKSWYSWVISSLVGAVYMFGFILMCPQLYLNYKLKSVAHLPWRQMTYKFLNTIIDDLFAFVIKMPLLHRLSVFRDDVVFMIFLYQRYIYKVDKTRVNEFGFAEGDAPADDKPEEITDGDEGVKAIDSSAEESKDGAEAEGHNLRSRKKKQGKTNTSAEAEAPDDGDGKPSKKEK